MKYLLQDRKKKEGRKKESDGRRETRKVRKKEKTKHEGKNQITQFQIFLF